jgi:hypothetical protein
MLFTISASDDFYILEFSLHKIFVCDLVFYYGVIMGYHILIHIYGITNVSNVVILEGREDMDVQWILYSIVSLIMINPPINHAQS